MTRVDHLRFRPWLLALIGVLMATIVAQVLGLGRDLTWLPPLANDLPEPLVSDATPAAPPLQALANTWEHPLFSPGRQPDVRPLGDTTPASLQGMVLTGSLVTDTLRVALLRDASGKEVSVAQGKALANGWTLERLDPTEALFVLEGQQQRLRLRPAPGRP